MVKEEGGAYSISQDQNYLELACIQCVSLGIPVIALGNALAKQYGVGTAICSVLVGNLILWLIAIMIISMAYEKRSNAVQNVNDYLGRYGSLCMWVLLIVSFIGWFVLQINSTLPIIGLYLDTKNSASLLRLGVGLGFLTALFAGGGIKVIKYFTVMSFPAVLCYYIYAIFQGGNSSAVFSWGISIPAVVAAILMLLPGVVNFPTFFRHAKSKGDAYLALAIMTILISFFEIATIWIQFTPTGNSLLSLTTLGFIVWTLICANLLNIYFASACWEGFMPRFEGAKSYAIIGLLGTVAYTFTQISAPILFIQNLTNSYISTLGVVLLIGFFIRIFIHHRPHARGKTINSFCWLVGCVTATILAIQNEANSTLPLLGGISASTGSFFCILFIEENIWAIRKILSNR